MERVLVFDVNETLLDVSILDDPFAEVFGTPVTRREWFARLLHLSTVVTALGKYVDFADLAQQALDHVAASAGVELDSTAREKLLSGLRALPPRRRRRARAAPGRRVPPRRPHEQWDGVGARVPRPGGARGLLHRRLLRGDDGTVQAPPGAVPPPMGVDIAVVRLVAAHDWDCAGALAAGGLAAWLARPGTTYAGALAPPDLQAQDLPSLAQRIIATDTAG